MSEASGSTFLEFLLYGVERWDSENEEEGGKMLFIIVTIFAINNNNNSCNFIQDNALIKYNI